MNIALHNLIFSGHHGLTSKEKRKAQKFKVDISIFPWRQVPIEEDISKTVDCKVLGATPQGVKPCGSQVVYKCLCQFDPAHKRRVYTSVTM